MITVLYACNDSYIRQTIVSMVSVLHYHSEVKFYLVGEALSRAGRDLLESVMAARGQTVRILDADAVLPKLEWKIPGRHPRTIYVKLFMDKAAEEERILYLDSDTVVNGSLEPLFARDMAHELVAGVLMPYSAGQKRRINTEPGRPYICDGVVLFNMELWRRMEKSEECVRYIRAWEGNPPMQSEGTLNHVCGGMTGILDPRYNLMPSVIMYKPEQVTELFGADCYYPEKDLAAARTAPVIVHFMNELYNRPWNEPCDHPWKELYRGIAADVFGTVSYAEADIPLRVKVTKRLYRLLPFRWFARLYGIRHGAGRGVRDR